MTPPRRSTAPTPETSSPSSSVVRRREVLVAAGGVLALHAPLARAVPDAAPPRVVTEVATQPARIVIRDGWILSSDDL